MIFSEVLLNLSKCVNNQMYSKYVLSILLCEASDMFKWGDEQRRDFKVWNTRKVNAKIIKVLQLDINSEESLRRILLSLYYYRGLAIRNEKLIGMEHKTKLQILFNDPKKVKIKFIVNGVKYNLDDIIKKAAKSIQYKSIRFNKQLAAIENLREKELKIYDFSNIINMELIGLFPDHIDLLTFLYEKEELSKTENIEENLLYLNKIDKMEIAERYISTNKNKVKNMLKELTRH